MGNPYTSIRSGEDSRLAVGASPPVGVDRSGAGETARNDSYPDFLPVWRSDWMRLRWIFLGGAIVLLASIGWSLVAARPHPLALALVLGDVAVFGGLMVEGVLGRPRRVVPVEGPAALGLVAAMTLLAVGYVAIEQGTLGTLPFFFAGIMAGRLRPDARAVRSIGAIAVLSVLVMLPFSRDIAGILVNGISVGILSLTVYGIRVLQRTNRELVLARGALARHAVAEERLRIARDLHDVLGHDLSVMALKSELARRLLPVDPARAVSEIEDVERTAREALRAVRETVSGYRQPVLAVELSDAREALAAAGIALSVEGDLGAMPPVAEAILAWTVREGTTNVIRHSGARCCTVRVDRSQSGASVELLDDGKDGAGGTQGVAQSGLAGWEAGAAESGREGSGLPGLAERVASGGGRMEAGPRPEGGFRVRVWVPLSDGLTP